MLTSAVPSTSNINGRLRCYRNLGLARQSQIAPHGPLTVLQSLLRPLLNDSPARIEDRFKAMGDINEVVAAIAIASTLDQD
jgi:hypothetical protein